MKKQSPNDFSRSNPELTQTTQQLSDLLNDVFGIILINVKGQMCFSFLIYLSFLQVK